MKTKQSKLMLLLLPLIIFSLMTFCAEAQDKANKTKNTKRIPASYGRSEYIEVEKNVKLHITDVGSGKTVVLIHGWPLSDAMFEYQYNFLVQKGYRVIGITMRGFGQSDKPYGKYDYDVFADDIKVVLDKLHLENIILGGYSQGGATALHYIARYNTAHVSKLALFASAAPSAVQREGFEQGAPKESIEGLIGLSNASRPKLIAVFGSILSETPLPTEMSSWLSSICLQASPYATQQCLILLRDGDLRLDLPKIKIPTAIFHGTKDKVVPFELSEVLHKGIKNSYVVAFEKSGHALFLEETEKFNNELLKFIK